MASRMLRVISDDSSLAIGSNTTPVSSSKRPVSQSHQQQPPLLPVPTAAHLSHISLVGDTHWYVWTPQGSLLSDVALHVGQRGPDTEVPSLQSDIRNVAQRRISQLVSNPQKLGEVVVVMVSLLNFPPLCTFPLAQLIRVGGLVEGKSHPVERQWKGLPTLVVAIGPLCIVGCLFLDDEGDEQLLLRPSMQPTNKKESTTTTMLNEPALRSSSSLNKRPKRDLVQFAACALSSVLHDADRQGEKREGVRSILREALMVDCQRRNPIAFDSKQILAEVDATSTRGGPQGTVDHPPPPTTGTVPSDRATSLLITKDDHRVLESIVQRVGDTVLSIPLLLSSECGRGDNLEQAANKFWAEMLAPIGLANDDRASGRDSSSQQFRHQTEGKAEWVSWFLVAVYPQNSSSSRSNSPVPVSPSNFSGGSCCSSSLHTVSCDVPLVASGFAKLSPLVDLAISIARSEVTRKSQDTSKRGEGQVILERLVKVRDAMGQCFAVRLRGLSVAVSFIEAASRTMYPQPTVEGQKTKQQQDPSDWKVGPFPWSVFQCDVFLFSSASAQAVGLKDLKVYMPLFLVPSTE